MKFLLLTILLLAFNCRAAVDKCPTNNLIEETNKTCSYLFITKAYCEELYPKNTCKRGGTCDAGLSVKWCHDEYRTVLKFHKDEIVDSPKPTQL